jgi:hypothetical protein
LISLECDFSLETRDIDFLACDLITSGAKVSLDIRNYTTFFIEKETEVIKLFLETNN